MGNVEIFSFSSVCASESSELREMLQNYRLALSFPLLFVVRGIEEGKQHINPTLFTINFLNKNLRL